MTPRIYVGTYAKYNSGSLHGAWLDLEDYANADDFYEACAKLHKSVSDPEYMFQDWEDIPDEFISESGLCAEYWDYKDTVEGSHLDEEIFAAASEVGVSVDNVEEAYSGKYGSDEDFAQELAADIGAMEEGNSWPHTCIDWTQAARELMMDYVESDGHYFRQM